MCNCNKKNKTTPKKVTAAPSNFINGIGAPGRNALEFQNLSTGQPQAATTEAVEVDGETIEDKCRTFAYMLGLENPVSKDVLIGALEVPSYGRSLMASTNQPARLNDLLNHPPRSMSAKPATPFANTQLLTKASKALMKWAVSGFPTVSKATLQKREDACLACPQLIESANTLQKISASSAIGTAVGTRTGNKSCASCGCVIRNKIRLATESCPLQSDENADLNRWGEVLKTA